MWLKKSTRRSNGTIIKRTSAKKGIGFLVAKEIEYLDALLETPAKPYVAIIGGAKVSDKIPVIEKMMEHVDTFMVGMESRRDDLCALAL